MKRNDDIEDLIKLIVQGLVDSPDHVSLTRIEGYKIIIFELSVAKEDIGKVIGRGGQNAAAIRTILNAASAKKKKRCILEIIEETESKAAPGIREGRSHDWHQKNPDISKAEHIGVVKWFDDRKGYGYITGDDSRDVFVHHTGIKRSGGKRLDEGDRVTFHIAQGNRGPKAINVIKV